ncbi:serine hydrolase domain-containing protein [Jiulongibacter sp. NS-SX5]|uniref:serine hydrolase domain-containing protein n=1 Tax=Jiulongibacter sp. NS-SX5 TaxID=3463854 RepID=UPI0040591D22
MKHFKYILLLVVLFSCEKTSPDPSKPDQNQEDEQQENISSIDDLVAQLMNQYDLPGASLAIAKNEKLVYLKSYGLSNTSSGQAMMPDHIMRVASTTKPYTGMAIMKLKEQGKLTLEDKVFGDDALLGKKYGTRAYSENLQNISVGQLLHNTTGAFVDANGYDMINRNEQLSDAEYMNWMLDNSYSPHKPGEVYYYNNVNFFVASILIEELSGISYFDFVKQEILDPIGDQETRMGINQNSYENEVNYYGQGNLTNNVYNFNLERYKGAGAMLGNARSLLKFALAVDGKDARKELLSPALLNEFKTVTSLQENWGHGLGIWGQRTYMYGALPGTRSGWLTEPSSGMSVALIFNGNADYTQAEPYQEFVFAVQDLLVNLVTIPRAYKNIDQF